MSNNQPSIILNRTPTELRYLFPQLKTSRDVADILEIRHSLLTYHLFAKEDDEKYTDFKILKVNGGERLISAPISSIKILQAKLNVILQAIYISRPPVHSFSFDRSVVTNAKMHIGRAALLNLDLKDFFPSINFGRVRGMFLAKPYFLGEAAATTLAQLSCHNNSLPQGSPASPIISNMICARMDSDLSKLAKKYKCVYTRYADDITLSTYLNELPNALCHKDAGQLTIGTELEALIQRNGFEINLNKIRQMNNTSRQIVTGVKVNQFPNLDRRYIRNIRAMLHAWMKFGLEDSEEVFRTEKDTRHRSEWTKDPSFKKVLKGKIEYLGMVKGKNDPVYINYRERLRRLEPALITEPPPSVIVNKADVKAVVLTEGKSDAKHLSAALAKLNERGKYLGLNIEIHNDPGGDDVLLRRLKGLKTVLQRTSIIGIFDRDELKKIKEAHNNNQKYVKWGNNVYSFAIPVPSHRKNTPEISLEFYYSDKEITTLDADGNRLFISDEFDKNSARLLADPAISCSALNLVRKEAKIIDHQVHDVTHRNIALPKDDFADYVYGKEKGFDNFNFAEFERIFSILELILDESK